MNSAPDWVQINTWRQQLRADLIARREQVPLEQRRTWNAAITAHIEAGFPVLAGMAIAFCWPYKGEFDARFAIRHFRARGAIAALPRVVAKASAMQFRKWWPGAPLTPGVYGIPVPEGTQIVVPDAALVPMNGFDGLGYRLGYGGGYFDITLATLAPRPLAIGVTYEFARLTTIWPQPHDIAMDFVVTEAGIYAINGKGLAPMDAAACGARAQKLRDERGLPRMQAAAGGRYASPTCLAADFSGYFGEQPSPRESSDPPVGDVRREE